MMRYLPPTATPLPLQALTRGLVAGSDAGKHFCRALSEYLGAQACFLAASGRTALYLLLTMLRAGADDEQRREVILPAYTCPSLVKVILDAGLTPRPVDITPETLAFVTPDLAAAVGIRTLAVILVHPFGIPHSISTACQLAHEAGAVLIEDAAQSLGARWHGRPAGTGGDFGLFSLGPGKPLSTGGGGFVCTGDPAQAERLATTWAALPVASAVGSWLALARLALFHAAFDPAGWWLAAKLGAQRVGDNESSWGYAIRGLTAAQAAVGNALLPHLDEINARRQRHAEQLMERLQGAGEIHIPVSTPLANGSMAGRRSQLASDAETGVGDLAGGAPIYLRLPVLVADEATCLRLYNRLRQANIGAGRMYRRTLPEFFPAVGGGDYPGAERVARCILTLPTHHYLTEPDIDRITRIVRTELGRSAVRTHKTVLLN